jgi:cytochrome c oxidase assembly protein subunit 11
MSPTGPSDRHAWDLQARRNKRVAAVCAVVFFAMVGAAFAAIPAYRAFCQATGFGGTIRKADKAPDQVLGETMRVSFDANVRGLPWTFQAEQPSQTMKIGETKLAFFKVTNNADHPITARAIYNVTPDSAGQYFHKLQCFCFSDQTVGAHQTVEMPVLYFVDPKYVDDINTKRQFDLTLSYTFFPATDVSQPPASEAAAAKPAA